MSQRVKLIRTDCFLYLKTAEETPSEQRAAFKQKQLQQAGAENDMQNIGATGITSQSFNASANHQQSQNNSQQSPAVSAALIQFDAVEFKKRFPQVQRITSESMIPTYRSGAEPLQKTNITGSHYVKQPQSQHQQQLAQQQNSSSFSANVPKSDNKNAVNNENNQNQCYSPVKRRSTSQTDVSHIHRVLSTISLRFMLCVTSVHIFHFVN